MSEKIKNFYVTQTLTRAWMNKEGKVSSYSPSKDKTTIGNPTRFFHRNIIDERNYFLGVFTKLDKKFEGLTEHFKTGDYKHIFALTVGIYSSILLQYERTPFYKALHETFDEKVGNLSQSTFLNGGYNWQKEKENREKSDAEFLFKKMGTIYYEELYIYDLERVYLHAPEGTSFILGPNPVNIINPLIENDYIEYEKNRYELFGTMIIWPMTPTVAVCYYDNSSYVLKNRNGRVNLDADDVEIINKIQIYNSKFTDEFVYAGDNDKTIKRLYKKHNSRLLLSYNDEDKYPFGTKMSFVGINEDMYSVYPLIKKDPRRIFVRDIQAFDDENLRGVSENDVMPILSRRFALANDKIFGKGRWQPFVQQYYSGK